MTGKFFMRLLY